MSTGISVWFLDVKLDLPLFLNAAFGFRGLGKCAWSRFFFQSWRLVLPPQLILMKAIRKQMAVACAWYAAKWHRVAEFHAICSL